MMSNLLIASNLSSRYCRLRDGGPLRRVAIYAAVLVGVFLLGLVPMWLSARGRAAERDEARRELRLCRIQGGAGG